MNTAAVRKRLIERDGHNCHICKKPIFAVPSSPVVKPHEMTIDHVVPKAKGGTDDDSNLRLAHYGCNADRGTKKVSKVAQPKPMEYHFSFVIRGQRVSLILQPQRAFDLRIEPAK